jgi:5-methylcytosine-specific restriction endonuclease McrA
MGKINTACIVCGADIYDWPSKKRKVCSVECGKRYSSSNLKEQYAKGNTFGEAHRANISKALKNSEKAKQYQFKRGEANPAYGRNQTGEANNNWKGGITNLNQQKRNDPRMKEWRLSVYARDNYTCQKCGSKGFLHAHHIVSLKEDLTKAFDVDNGITVCVPCHEAIHGRYIGKFKQKK